MDANQSILAGQGEYVPTLPSAGVSALEAKARTAAAAEQKAKDNTHFGDLIGAAIVRSSPISWIDRRLQESGIQSDPEFYGKKLEAVYDEWMKQGLGDQTELLTRATSAEHAQLLKTFAMQNKMADEDLGRGSWYANIGASALDPSMFAVGALSGGLGYSANAGRLANAVRAGLVGATTNVGTEALSSQYNPEIDSGALVSAAASGLLLGGAFGFRNGELADMAAGVNKTLKGSAPLGNQADSMGAARVKGSTQNVVDGPAETVAPSVQDRLDAAAHNAHIETAFGKARADMAASAAKSKSSLFRNEMRGLMNDSTGYTDRNLAVKYSAVEEAELLDHTILGGYRRGVEPVWAKFSQESGAYGPRARQNFNESVGYHMRGAADQMSPEVAQVAKHVDEAIRTTHEELRAAGVPGFDFDHTPGYLPRLFSGKGYLELNGTKGLSFENLRDNLVKPAMRSAWVKNLADGETIDEHLLDAVAEAWLSRAHAKAVGTAGELGSSMKAADLNSVRSLLKEHGVEADKIDALVGKWEKAAGEKSVHSRAKARIDMDESFKTTLTNDLGETHEVRLADLLENDVDKLVSDYSREMAGWVALKKHVNVGTPSELDAYKAMLAKHAKDSGDGDRSRFVDIVTNSVLGRSTMDAPHSAWTRGSRMIRGHNFLTTMGRVGYTMIESVGSTIGAVGLRNALKAVPVAGDMLKGMRRGTFKTEDAKFLADLMGAGTDFVRNQPHLRLDAIGETMWDNATAVGRSLNSLDRSMQYATRAMSVASGIAPMQSMLSGLAAGGLAGRLIELANMGRVSAAMTRRLRTNGIDEAMQKALFARMRGKTTLSEVSADFANWSREEQRAFALYLHRTTKRTLGEGNVGTTIQLMHSATGRIFTQFRTFQNNSYSMVLLHGLHMRDWQTAQMWMGSLLFATVGMSARAYIDTIGEPQEERDKRLAPDALFKTAFQQAQFSALIPFAVDTIAHDLGVRKALTGNDAPFFQFGRSTGLDSGVQGIPALSTARSLWSLPSSAMTLLDPKQNLSKKQVKDFTSLLWFNNLTGVKNGMSWIAQQFPDSND